MPEKIRVGKIVNTHALKGEVRVYPYTDYAERFNEIKSVYINDSENEMKILGVKYIKNMVILKLEGINTIEEAEKYRDSFIFIDKKFAKKLDQDEHRIADIIGFKVYDTKGEEIGILEDVLQYSANDVYVVKGHDDKKYMIPGLKRFIPVVDESNSKIVIDPIEGMLE